MKGDIPQRSIRSSISRIVEFIAPRMISSVMASTAGGESGDAGPWVTTRSDLALMERIVAERRRGKAPWGATAPTACAIDYGRVMLPARHTEAPDFNTRTTR